MLQWPSTRVPQGGVYHPPKVRYSQETAQFLKTLIEESKLTNRMRNNINYTLRTGESLSPVGGNKSKNKSKTPGVRIRPGSSKRRMRDTIIQSGAYERDQFVPVAPRIDREKLKKHLQNVMAYGKDTEVTPRIPPKTEKKEPKQELNRFDELVQEIKEREEWLEEMEKYGEGHKWRNYIHLQIQQKLKEMEKLKVEETPIASSKNSARS